MFYFYKMNTLMIYLYCKMGCNSEKNLKISPFSTKNQETIEKICCPSSKVYERVR